MGSAWHHWQRSEQRLEFRYRLSDSKYWKTEPAPRNGTGSDFLLDGGVTAAYWCGELAQ